MKTIETERLPLEPLAQDRRDELVSLVRRAPWEEHGSRPAGTNLLPTASLSGKFVPLGVDSVSNV